MTAAAVARIANWPEEVPVVARVAPGVVVVVVGGIGANASGTIQRVA